VNAEIIAVGSELLTPYRRDTNSLFLTEKLNQLGVEVGFKTIVGDNREHIVSVARVALGRANIVILMGGLGPTEDDLTREAVAEALGLELKRNPEVLGELYARFAARRMKMPENNARQADVLAGAILLANANGTAPGQWIEGTRQGEDRIVILLPGPPNELRPLFEQQCMERLRAKVPPQFIATRVLKVAMMPESKVDAIAAPIYRRHKKVQTTILAAAAGEVQLHLRARGTTPPEGEAAVNVLAEELEDALDEHIFSRGGESLEQIVEYYLEMRGATLAVAESCTGGLLAERLTSISGSSRSFVAGAVTYANESKTVLADVPAVLIARHGAVSREVAAAMAEGIRQRCHATLGVGITGIAGPTGGTKEKPVGLVYHALADGRKTEIIERRFPGDRERVRWWATQQALDMLRRKLM